jgi:UDP-N-acetylmuramoyl-tripeptide--D-alanyl-D-alanine ligase
MKEPLWRFPAFLAATRGRLLGSPPEAIVGVSIDSRTVAPGEAFFAIKGDRFDGHDFVAQALAGGAGLAVVAKERVAGLGELEGAILVVDDVLASLADLGRAARARGRARIAAITGSVGKTGTKEMLARALSPDGEVHFSPASFNNHWGVPLTLSRLPASAKYAVFEIGMNHAGEIEPLVKMVRPHVALITTVEPVHLEFFPSETAIAEAKAEIFLGVEAGGAAVINRDNRHFAALARLAQAAGIGRIVGFGEAGDAGARLKLAKLKPECSCVSAEILGEQISYKLAAPGRHLVQNSLAVLAAVVLLGGDLAKAALALAELEPPRGRGARHRLAIGGRAATLIDESYNANPASMRAAMALLGQAQPAGSGRRIAVLGDMLELGPKSADLHAGLADAIAEAAVDRVYLAGPLMRALWEKLPPARRASYAESAGELTSILSEELGAGDVVMVKGSNGSRMGPLVEALKARFAPAVAAADEPRGQEYA